MFDKVIVVVNISTPAPRFPSSHIPPPDDEEDQHPRDNKEEVDMWKKYLEKHRVEKG